LDVEVTELVFLLVGGNNTEEITEILLLQELLGEVLEVLLAVLHGGGNSEEVLFLIQVDLDLISELTLLTVELGVGKEVLFEGTDHFFVEDTILNGNGAIDLEDLLTLREGSSADVTLSTDLLADSDHFLGVLVFLGELKKHFFFVLFV
jgi:hypothetical protein